MITYKNKAFTLSEVLITLGIIGIVAAMTMPSLMASYQKKQAVTQLKKVYTDLNSAFRLSVAQNGEAQYWDDGFIIGADAFFNKYWKPYLKVLRICKNYNEYCGYKRIEGKNSPWVDLRNQPVGVSFIAPDARTTLQLVNGTTLVILTKTGGVDDTYNPSKTIMVDINGVKPPNMIGKDVFVFDYNNNGVVPSGINFSRNTINSNCSTSNSGSSAGFYCAAKIVKDKWEIKGDYPW